MSAIKKLWSDYCECVDLRRVLTGAVFATWIFLQFNSALPYSYDVRYGLLSVVPGLLYLSLFLFSLMFYLIRLKKPQLLKNTKVRYVFTLAWFVGCVFFTVPVAGGSLFPGCVIAVVLIGFGFASTLSLIGDGAHLSCRRRAVEVHSAMIAAAALSIIAVVVPQLVGRLIYVLLPLVATLLIYRGKKNGRANVETSLNEPDKVSIDARDKAWVVCALFLFSVFYSLLLQTYCAETGYSAVTFGISEGVLGFIALLILLICYTIYIVKKSRGALVAIAKPFGVIIMFCFILRYLVGPKISFIVPASALVSMCCLVACAWVTIELWSNSPTGSISKMGIYLSGGLAFGQLLAILLYKYVPAEACAPLICVTGLFIIGTYYWLKGDKGFYSILSSKKKATISSMTGNADAIDALVKTGNLSRRERDVLQLLVKGRSLPFICDELVISKSTAQTHKNHIYAKLKVSSIQGLLDLYEEAASGGNNR